MFEVGFSELLVIFVLALVVLGPERLPRLAQQVGRWIGRARAMAKQFREQLEDEVNLADMKKWQDTSSSAASSDPTSSTSQSDTAGQSETTGAQADTTGQRDGTPNTAAAHEAETAAATPETAPSADTAEQSAASSGPGHYAGPAPEPEASVYQPPAYGSAGAASSANGATPHSTSAEPAHAVESAAAATQSNSTASHDPAPASDERPARPGDVITHTHERGI